MELTGRSGGPVVGEALEHITDVTDRLGSHLGDQLMQEPPIKESDLSEHETYTVSTPHACSALMPARKLAVYC